VKNVRLRGEVNASLSPEGAGGRPRTVHCGELVLGFYADANALEYAEATKDCALDFEDDSGRPVSVQAGERTILYFAPGGELKDFEAKGDTRVVLEAGAGGGRRECRAERVLYHQAGKALRLIGREGAPAVFDIGDTTVEGADIRAGLESGNIQAAGAVRVVLKPSPQGPEVGFFSRQNPIVTVCEEMRYVKAPSVSISRPASGCGGGIPLRRGSGDRGDTTGSSPGRRQSFSPAGRRTRRPKRIAVGAEAKVIFPLTGACLRGKER
jgi:hypothetical protein